MVAEPVPASTIILLRGRSAGAEVLMIERHVKSEAFANFYVFPGGRVEEEDHALADRVGGIKAAEAAAALGGMSPEFALDFFVAAIRETFEEVGILLARPRGQRELLDGERAAALARYRLDVQGGRMSFRELIDSQNLELAGDSLAVHAHWITPEFMPRRFDTFFFTALAPPGQLAEPDGVETTAHVWIRPEEALEQRRARTRRIIFPTAVNLESVAGFSTAPEALQASRRRSVIPVLPRLVDRDGKQWLVIPAEAGYATTEDLIGG